MKTPTALRVAARAREVITSHHSSDRSRASMAWAETTAAMVQRPLPRCVLSQAMAARRPGSPRAAGTWSFEVLPRGSLREVISAASPGMDGHSLRVKARQVIGWRQPIQIDRLGSTSRYWAEGARARSTGCSKNLASETRTTASVGPAGRA